MDKLLKIQGYLIAGAIGDALGFIVEKKPFPEVEEFADQLYKNKIYTIPFRTFPKDYLFGQYSDDTQFSRLLIESVIEGKSYKELLIDEYVKGNLIGLGTNTRKVLSYYSKNKSPIPEHMIDNISNGSLMRTGVLGLLFEESELKTQVEAHSKITHNHPGVFQWCYIYSSLVYDLMTKDTITDSEVLTKLPEELAEVLKEFKAKPLEDFRQYIVSSSQLASDWQGIPPLAKETLMAVLLVFLKHRQEPFEKFITQILKLGGDTDSTAALSGSLYGTLHGLNSIPSHFRGIIHDQNNFKENYFFNLSLKIQAFNHK